MSVISASHRVSLPPNRLFCRLVPSSLTPGNRGSPFCLDRFPFPECHVLGVVQCVAFPDGLLSLSNTHLRFSLWLGGLFLVMNNILSDVCTAVYPSPTEGRTPWLLPGSGSYGKSCRKHRCAGFRVDISFPLLCVNTNVHGGWAIWREPV